jgi:hypothetical protein
MRHSPTATPAAALALLASLTLAAPGAGACSVQSGPTTAALVELYTSEGCSSCPPADRLLGRIRQEIGTGAQAYALALHVDYWDDIGWKDPYAQGIFSERHRWLVAANGHATTYTPHFFLNGTELSTVRPALGPAVERINAAPAGATIALQARLAAGGPLVIDANASATAPQQPAALYLAVAESGLVSKVTRGENGGSTLTHDHVVRQWIGPIALVDGHVQAQRELSLPAGVQRSHLEVVAFVADEHSGRVLQALGTGRCSLDAPAAGGAGAAASRP